MPLSPRVRRALVVIQSFHPQRSRRTPLVDPSPAGPPAPTLRELAERIEYVARLQTEMLGRLTGLEEQRAAPSTPPEAAR